MEQEEASRKAPTCTKCGRLTKKHPGPYGPSCSAPVTTELVTLADSAGNICVSETEMNWGFDCFKMKSKTMDIVVCCLLLMLTCVGCSPNKNKILLYPIDHPGHVNYHLVLGQALMKNGYDVYLLTVEKHRAKIESVGIKPLLHKPIKVISPHDDPELQGYLQKIIEMGEKAGPRVFMPLGAKVLARFKEQAEEILQNDALQAIIQELQFDLALIDAVALVRVHLVLAYKHDIRFITVSPLPDPWVAGLPSMPSVEPLALDLSTNQMSFFQRMQSLLFYIMFTVIPHFSSPDDLVEKYVPDKPSVTLAELHARAHMFFINTDPYLLDYPRISGTNYVYLGAIGGEPPKPLQPDLESFVSSAKGGTVVVSFGSVAKKLPVHLLSKLLAAFKLSPSYHFVMRYDGELKDVAIPQNVRLLKWLPQNDLLGHEATKLFFTHGGNNGQIEGLYHGVPTIVAPLFGDQRYNANRFVARGYGVKLNLVECTEGEVVDALKEVLGNSKYTKAIKKAQAIHHALPKGNETAVFWMDHVIKYGSDHLRPVSMSLPLYKLFMLDVLFVILTVVLCIVCICYKCGRWCCRKCQRQRSSIKKSKKE